MAEAGPTVIEYLKTHRLCVLATGRRDGSPQQSLVGYQFDGDDFVISARRPSAKARNMRRQPRVSLTVPDGPRVVVVYGEGKVVRDPEAVFRLNLARLGGFRREVPLDEQALRERLAREERVVLVITAEKYLAARLG